MAPQQCMDPKSFDRGGPTLTVFFFTVDERNQIPRKAGLHWLASEMPLNGFSLAGQRWPNIECWLGSLVIFQGIQTSIARKPYIFVVFQGVSGPPVPPLERICQPGRKNYCHVGHKNHYQYKQAWNHGVS